MARHAEGWRIRKPKGRKTYSVYFRINGERTELSTGAGDPFEAQKAAERIYADAVQRAGVQPKLKIVRRGEAPPLDDLIATWLAGDTTLDPATASVYETYGRHWLAHWETLADVTDNTAEDYRNARLRKVQGVTVHKEIAALRRFLRWCNDRGHLPRIVNVPGVPKKAPGTRHTQRRRVAAPELAPKQIEALIEALPEWSAPEDKRKRETKRAKAQRARPRLAVRARFRVQYETGLRPSTIDALEVPTHYTRGASLLRITPEIDKVRHAREVPLSPAARKALDAVVAALPKMPDGKAYAGTIFGHHDYRKHLAAAAAATLPKAAAAVFTGAHLRSARITHWLEATGNLPGVQHLVGHEDTRSTNRYLRPTFRAAAAVLDASGTRSRAQRRLRR
jgi:site-specific recombinase XerC